MRVNPVYLVLGLLSMVYAAPVDLGSDLGSHSNFEKTLRARTAQDNHVVFTRFTGVHARNGNLRPPRPPPIVEMLVRQGLATHFKEEMDDPEWRIKFDNEFIPDQWTPNTHGLSLLFGIVEVELKTT
ncbi:hypothetical protein LENED_002503 [Lentinula edodes]|uniref:Uncharacterized protein n=1 Tax=Lentinula edodes TaxID=5353 RepID=A0A1Q3E1B0_LENED|nr:hypothetical protein LENED_002503 [Lentinula edodes]